MTTTEQMEIERARMQAHLEGHVAGRARGLAEGRLETITELLQQKFGALDKTVNNLLRELNYAQLKDLTAMLLKLDSLDELHEWVTQATTWPPWAGNRTVSKSIRKSSELKRRQRR